MKHFTFISSLASAILCLAACQDASSYLDGQWTVSVNARYLRIDRTDFSFGANQDLVQTLHVSSVETGWKITDAGSWLSVSPQNGNADAEVVMTASENTSGDDIRTCIMTFSSTEADYAYKQPIAITQSKAVAYITPNQQTVRFSRDASTQTVDINANTRWEARCNASWVKLSSSSDQSKLSISVEENNSTAERIATIQIDGSTTATIQVVQSGSIFDNQVGSLYFGNKAGSQNAKIETDGRWQASVDANWISLSATEGVGASVLMVNVIDNPNESERIGKVTVTVGNTEKVILVTQAGTYFTVDSSASDAIPAVGGQHSITFTSSDKWTANTNSNWVTLQPASGEMGKSVLTIIAAENTAILARYDTTYIIPDNDHLQPYRIITKQEGVGYHLRVDKTSIVVSSASSTASLSIVSNDNWTVSSTVGWAILSQTAGEGNAKVDVTFEENTQPETRNGKITLKSDHCDPITIDLSQAGIGYHLMVDKTSIDAGYAATTESISIISNDTWAVTSSESWITVTPTTGTGDEKLTVSIAESAEALERTGRITITGKNSESIFIIVYQQGIGYHLTVNPLSLSVGSGSETKTLSIKTNDSWRVSSLPNWISISEMYGFGDCTLSVNISANTGPETRTGTITIKGSNTPAVNIMVSQNGVGYNLSVDKTEINVGAGSTTESFSITSNDSWTVSSSASWARPATTSGSGSKSVALEIDRNTSTEAREATITIQHSHGSTSTTIIVHQSEGGQNDITIEDFEDPIPLN